MIRISQMKMKINHNDKNLLDKILKSLKVKETDIIKYKIAKKSIDSRKKNDIKFVYTVDVEVENENQILKNISNKEISYIQNYKYELLASGDIKLKERPVIIGSGPCGLFSGLLLAELGYNPIILEQGMDVDTRNAQVNEFWEKGILNEKSNVQFGEGGAGTFSDGKLNTLVKDKNKRGRKVLEEFVKAGAPEEILYINKPHIGTDILREVVKNIRKKIISLGGEVRFNSEVTAIKTVENKICSVIINNDDEIKTNIAILAIGHSSRNTFEMLNNMNVDIQQKSFAIGVRIEHPQVIINKSQYGDYFDSEYLGSADYKLKHQCLDNRAVYTFCMCPGGVVVGASSEENTVVTNGMSYYKRDKENANSALLVTVTPKDFMSDHPLAGMYFQRKWEQQAFKVGGNNYNAPVQLVGDFLKNIPSIAIGSVTPSYSNYTVTSINKCLPEYIINDLKEGIKTFDRKIKGFAMNDAILTGVETRSSSPIRITRDENFESNIKGIYPAGEGAGYAGGIMSAAMDGIKIVETIVSKYAIN